MIDNENHSTLKNSTVKFNIELSKITGNRLYIYTDIRILNQCMCYYVSDGSHFGNFPLDTTPEIIKQALNFYERGIAIGKHEIKMAFKKLMDIGEIDE